MGDNKSYSKFNLFHFQNTMVKIKIVDKSYEKARVAEHKSMLWKVWIFIFLLIPVGYVIDEVLWLAMPEVVNTIFIVLILLPLIVIVWALIVIFIHGFIYIVASCIKLQKRYEKSKFTYIVETITRFIFPHTLYTKLQYRQSKSRNHKMKSVYYGVFLNVIFFSIVLLFIAYTKFPQVLDWVNEHQNTIKNMIRNSEDAYTIHLWN